ncbi:hypothetical protein AB1Y20_004083 [Prymnesium parvum]|uniref:SEC7 domain-containing protein n=1 Tax=Prymnesium parvum TaxID=97485 RepID=A0AB34J8E9_PRYPA
MLLPCLLLASASASADSRRAAAPSLASAVAAESTRVSSLLRRQPPRPALLPLLHQLERSALHAAEASDASAAAVRCLQTLLRLLDEAEGAAAAAPALSALSALLRARAYDAVAPAERGGACRALCACGARRLLAPAAEPEVRRGGLEVLAALLAEGGVDAARAAWRAIAAAGGGRLLGLRLLRARLCHPAAVRSAALARLVLPALVEAAAPAEQTEEMHLAIETVPLLFLRLDGDACALELGLLLRHLLLAPLLLPAAAPSAALPRSRLPSVRHAALRSLALCFSPPRAVERLLVEHDAHPQYDSLLPSLCHALAPPPHADDDDAVLRLRVCHAIFQQLPLLADIAPAAAEAKAALLAKAAAFNADPKAAVGVWREEGTIAPAFTPPPSEAADGTSGGEAERRRRESEGKAAAEAAAGEELGKMLFMLPGLSPQAVGDFLARPEALSKAAIRSFMRSFDFGGLSLDGGLRLVFAALKMPGEAQKVDRVMQAFAHAYYRDEPGPFASEKAAYVMSFSLMMLNTDQHNAAVRTKMTLEQFVHNNRKINEGADLPPAFLAALYFEVQRREIKACEDAHTSPRPPTVWRWRYLQQRRDAAAAAAAAAAVSPSPPPPSSSLASASASAPASASASASTSTRLARELSPAAMHAAEGVLLLDARLRLRSVGGAYNGASWRDEAEAYQPQDWLLAVRVLLRVVALASAHAADDPPAAGQSTPLYAAINQMVLLLCEHSLLPSNLAAPEAVARAACFNHRSICLGSVAALLARAYPAALGDVSWYQLLRTVLAMHQLGIVPAPSTTAPLDDPIGAKIRALYAEGAARASSAARVVSEAAEPLLGMAAPPPTHALWMQQRTYQHALQPLQPSAVLSALPLLPPPQHAALLHAAFRTLDDAVHLALRDAHGGVLPATTAVQLLTELLLGEETPRVAPWARAAGCERMGRIVAASGCPIPVSHAAAHALRSLQAHERKAAS